MRSVWEICIRDLCVRVRSEIWDCGVKHVGRRALRHRLYDSQCAIARIVSAAFEASWGLGLEEGSVLRAIL